MTATRPRRRRAAVQFTVGLVASCIVASALWLVALVAVPAVALGWDPVVISSGSMAPALATGDVVVARSYDGGVLPLGEVVVFRDQSRSGRLVTHRVVALNDDGTYRTRGDANGTDDSTPLSPHQIVGVAELLVPAVGHPTLWLVQGRVTPFLALSVVAVLLLRLSSEAGKDPWRPDGPRSERRAGRSSHRRPSRARVAGATGLLALAVALTLRPEQALAALRATTANASNSFAASATFTCSSPGTVTVTAEADTFVSNGSLLSGDPSTNYGTQTTLEVRSLSSGDRRTYVRFALPPVPKRCAVTGATLRLHARTAATGRTLQALAAAASWTESGLTWSNQPGATGTAAATTSGTGWREFGVSTTVQGFYAGTNHGFVVRDSSEGALSGQTQSFDSREGTNPPQLLVTFG